MLALHYRLQGGPKKLGHFLIPHLLTPTCITSVNRLTGALKLHSNEPL